MQDAPYPGPPNFNLKLHSLPPRPSILLSQSRNDVIPIMDLLQEMREQDFKVVCTKPYVYCKVFEDNLGALELKASQATPKDQAHKHLLSSFL
jgi:hypothetical protein